MKTARFLAQCALIVIPGLWILLSQGCRTPERPAGPLPQWGYLWQRDWNPSVAAALREADEHLNGVVILGAEILWDGKNPRAIRAGIPWAALRKSTKPVALGLRIAPYPGPFSRDDEQVHAIAKIATSLLDEARKNSVALSEFQIDFDCAQKKLPGYGDWLRTLVPAVRPGRVVITALPAWLNEPGFPALAREVDGYVLQVHSVPTWQESRRAVLCDPVLARKWVGQASALGIPFTVALPTYWCLAGYDPDGKLVSVAMESVDPTWPEGTRALAFETHANEIASLVHDWSSTRPRAMQGVLWYRVPVQTDLRNWRWPTLLAVMAGRNPVYRLQVTQAGENPVDLTLVNSGEADEALNCQVTVKWKKARLTAFDALPGWNAATTTEEAIFTTTRSDGLRLSSGGKVGIGWMRFEKAPELQIEVSPHERPTR